MPDKLTIVGGGLAGCEAAFSAVKQGVKVQLFEMRPEKMTPAHSTGNLAELICSNSLGSMKVTRALGLLKEELRMLGSKLLEIAEVCAVPAGTGLTVNREEFSRRVTEEVDREEMIELVRKEVVEIPREPVILASGPLSSEGLTKSIGSFCGREYLYFYDAVAPIVSADSLDMDILVKAARYEAGDAGFLNAFMDKEGYLEFYRELVDAEQHELHDADEDRSYFEGCLPLEEIARRGERSLSFGPLRPTGFRNADGHRPWAVVQLRPEDTAGTMYNLVGFQTNLKNGEQERVFRMIPGLANAHFERYGRLHRNTYIQAPELLDETLQFRNRKDMFVCGQLSGAEGYLSAIATGLVAGMNTGRMIRGKEPVILPVETMSGALLGRMAGKGEYALREKRYTPTKPMLGLLPALTEPPRNKEERRQAYADRSLENLNGFIKTL